MAHSFPILLPPPVSSKLHWSSWPPPYCFPPTLHAHSQLQAALVELEACRELSAGVTSDASVALLASYTGFAHLLRSQEGRLLQLQGEAEKEEEEGKKAVGGVVVVGEAVVGEEAADGGAEKEGVVPAVESALQLQLQACRDGVELSYQQLRAFARRFSEESAEVASELKQRVLLGGGGVEPVPERMGRELGAALHLGLA